MDQGKPVAAIGHPFHELGHRCLLIRQGPSKVINQSFKMEVRLHGSDGAFADAPREIRHVHEAPPVLTVYLDKSLSTTTNASRRHHGSSSNDRSNESTGSIVPPSNRTKRRTAEGDRVGVPRLPIAKPASARRKPADGKEGNSGGIRCGTPGTYPKVGGTGDYWHQLITHRFTISHECLQGYDVIASFRNLSITKQAYSMRPRVRLGLKVRPPLADNVSSHVDKEA
jgi:hypothetical protein